jgi:hypothetical protein
VNILKKISKSFSRSAAWIFAPMLMVSFLVSPAPVKALSPVFESTAAARVTLGSLASRTQCTALGKQGIGPYTMTGTDATSNSSYSYVTDKNYTREQQLYEGQEATTQNLSYSTSTGQAYGGRSGVIRLFSSGIISYANTCNNHGTYGSAFGPEIWTEPFPATANQSISFDWAAAGGGDDYEAYGYLVKVSASGNTYDYGSSATSTLVSYGRGQNQGWVTSSGIVPFTGYYRFRFVNGSYDATGGQALGASMYIDSAISVASANTITFAQPADIVTSSSNQTFTVSATATSGLSVTFTSSTTGKCTVGSSTDSGGTSTATVTVLASQTGTCTISANSSANNSYVSASTVSQSFTLLAGSTAPTTSGGTSMSGTVASGNTLTAVDGTWGDGGSAVTATTYQWQSCTPSSCTWTNISGATSSTYVISSDDVAKQIRVRVTKTNSIGSLTANSAASITVTAAYLNAVTNLTAVANADGSVDLDWDASAASNTAIYGYSVSFYDLTVIGGAQSGGWGVWTNQGTNYSLSTGMFSGSNPVTTGYGPVRFGIKAMTAGCAGVGTGSCTYGPEVTVDATVVDPTPVTTTSSTTSTTTTTTTVAPTTTSTTTTTVAPTTTTTTTIPPVPTGTTTTTEAPSPVAPVDTTPPAPELEPEPETTTTTELEIPVTTTIPEDTTPVVIPEEEVTPVVIPEDLTPEIIVPEDVQDAADAAVENIFDGPMSDAKLEDAVDDLIADVGTPEEMTAVVGSLLDQDLSDNQFATVIASVFSEPLSDENFEAAVDAVFEDPTQLSDAQFENAVTAVFDAPLSDSQFESAVAAIFENVETLSAEQFDAAVQAVFDEPLSTEQFSAALDTIFDEPITDEKFGSVIDSILDAPISIEQFGELVNVLESDTVTQDQVSQAVDSIIENEISADQSAELSASPKVLESITPEQATEVFASLDIANVTPEQEAELAAALTDAPQDIKEALEQEVDIYGDGFDDYTAVGSNIDVGTRKTMLAATTALAAAAASMGGTGGGLGGGSGSGGGPNNNKPGGEGMPAGRKEEEEEEEVEIEGPEGPEKGNFTKNSIFKYQEGTMSKKFSPWGFVKKFSRETAAMAFTISGSVIVFATLSGDTRRITLIATLSAFAVHYVYVMLKNDED